MTELPEGLDGDQYCVGLHLWTALGMGVPDGSASGWGEQSIATRVAAVRS